MACRVSAPLPPLPSPPPQKKKQTNQGGVLARVPGPLGALAGGVDAQDVGDVRVGNARRGLGHNGAHRAGHGVKERARLVEEEH